ncbi:SDR family oxidoreductase [Candidatus Cyanaurora vandensis]|uniref:SDR family oxidoreductase n=1 Tax=Candidatus Cyanaurora vandensis TaxID=2714958 RepID=UPI00257FA435|nr:SDR family oxidoreductase [Candidatus Cyanaurora vandensis]
MQTLVVGAQGETGRRIIEQLQLRGIPTCGLVRSSEGVELLKAQEIRAVVGDVLQPATLTAALQGVEVVFCATGARPFKSNPQEVDYQGTLNLVDQAKAAGVGHFILVSSLCVSRFFHPLNLFGGVLFWKRQAEKYLQRSGLAYTIVRPGGLQNLPPDQPGVLIRQADTLFEGRIDRADVARVCIESALEPSARHKILEIINNPGPAPIPSQISQVPLAFTP